MQCNILLDDCWGILIADATDKYRASLYDMMGIFKLFCRWKDQPKPKDSYRILGWGHTGGRIAAIGQFAREP